MLQFWSSDVICKFWVIVSASRNCFCYRWDTFYWLFENCCWPFFKNSCMNFCFYLSVVSTCVWAAQRIAKEERERCFLFPCYLSICHCHGKMFSRLPVSLPSLLCHGHHSSVERKRKRKRLKKESFWKYFFLFLSFILGDEQLEAATPVWCSPSLSVCLTTVPSASAECDRVLYPLYGSVQQQDCWSVVSVCVCMCVCVTVVQKSFADWDCFFFFYLHF